MRVILSTVSRIWHHGTRIVVGLLGGALLLWAILGDEDVALDTALMLAGVALVVLSCFIERIEELKGGGFMLRLRSSDVGRLGAEVEQARVESPDPVTLDLPGDDLWDGALYRLGERAIEWLLTDLRGALFGCEARVFLYDDNIGKLMPAFRPSAARSADPQGWDLGQGVTGVAYKERRYAFAEGERTHDGTYGLTPEMRERYADVTAVAAQPLYDRDGKVIGVLSLSSRSAATKLTTDLGLNEQVALAEQVSVTLVDLLRVTA